jgi:hypothetical protein
LQYCPSCGKSIEDQASSCPFCGHEVKPAAIAEAALNFLFWGVGYYQAGVTRPFGRTWLIWPLVYVIYAFVG